MKDTLKIFGILIVAVLLLLNLASALNTKSISADSLSPGKTGIIRIELENDMDDTITDVSIRLDLTNLPFTPVGSSEDSIDEIEEDDDQGFSFRIKASNDITPGDYKIPYTIDYKYNEEPGTRAGSIGVTVRADADLSYTISTETPVVNEKGKITLKIVNKGFADARFLSVKLIPEGYTVFSDEEVYIGTVDSDDFESASFDVLFKDKAPLFTALIQYKDFDNKDISETVNLPITVYSQEDALKLGIITKSNTPLYAGVVIGIIIIYLIYRSIRKRLRKNRNKKGRN